MKQAMDTELDQAITSLQRANDLLMSIFNTKEADTEEMADCTRCGQEVEAETLVTYGDWHLCELCQGDI
jgi:hypothetical protein